MDPLVLFLVVVSAAALAGIGLMIRSLLRAPEGYQDAEGFHFGAPNRLASLRSKPMMRANTTTMRARRRSRARSQSAQAV